MSGKMLFELLPDLFPNRWLTDIEMEVWAEFFADRAKRSKSKRGK